jgi:hypothetical protein
MDGNLANGIRRRALIASIVLTAVVVAPTAVWAADRFTDVPDSNVFHDDIGWLADSGVTIGCDPPANTLFCPSDEVTREQMAAFLRRLSENQVVDAGEVDGYDAVDLVPGGDVPPGTTITGSYFVAFHAAAANDTGVTSLSFGYALDGPPAQQLVRAGQSPTTACPGSVTDPQAQPGYLCVYESASMNAGTVCVTSSVPFYDCDSADPFGAGVWVQSAAAGETWTNGVWALTVPAGGIHPPLSDDALRPPPPNAPLG